MPIYESNGKQYNIPEEKVESFLKAKKGAKLVDSTPFYLTNQQPKITTANNPVVKQEQNIKVEPVIDTSSLFAGKTSFDNVKPGISMRDTGTVGNLGLPQNQRVSDAFISMREKGQIPAKNEAERQTGFFASPVGDAIEKLGSGALRLVSGLALSAKQPTSTLAPHEKLNTPEDPDAPTALQGWFGAADELSEKGDRFGTMVDPETGETRKKTYSDLWKEGRKGAAIGEVMLTATESLPTSIAAMIPYAGLPLVAMSAAGMKYQELDSNPDLKGMDEWKKILNASVSGAVEGLTEKLGAKVDTKIFEPLLKNITEETVKKTLAKGGINMLIQALSEGGEEILSGFGSNSMDYLTGVTDEYKPFEGAKDSFVYGMGGGMQFGAMTGAGTVYRATEVAQRNRNLRKTERAVSKHFPNWQAMKANVDQSTIAERESSVFDLQAVNDMAPEAKKAYADYIKAKNEVDIQNLRREQYKQQEIVQMENRANSIIDSVVNPQTNSIIIANVPGAKEIRIYGDIVLKEDGTIDEKQSKNVYYTDAEGKRHVVSPKFVEIIENTPADQAKQELVEITTTEIKNRQANEEVRPYDPGEIITFSTDGAVSLLGQIASRNEDGSYQVQVEGMPEPVRIEPRMIVPEDNIKGIENGMQVQYRDEQGNVQTGIVNDAFSLRTQGLIDIDGNMVKVADIIPLDEMSADGADNEVSVISGDSNMPVNAEMIEQNVITPEKQAEIERQEFMQSLPVDKDGNIDYEQITDDAAYLRALQEEYRDKPEEVNAILNEYLQNAQNELAKADKITDPIKKRRAKAKAQADLDRYQGMIDSLQPQKAEAEDLPAADAVKPEPAVEPEVPDTPVVPEQTEKAVILDKFEAEERAIIEEADVAKSAEEQRVKAFTKEQREKWWGEPRTLREYILRKFIDGQKILWKDDEGSKGFAAHLGLKNAERLKRIGLIGSKAKTNAKTPEQIAHVIWEELGEAGDVNVPYHHLRGHDTMEILDEVLDVVKTNISTGMMITEINESRLQEFNDAIDYNVAEALQAIAENREYEALLRKAQREIDNEFGIDEISEEEIDLYYNNIVNFEEIENLYNNYIEYGEQEIEPDKSQADYRAESEGFEDAEQYVGQADQLQNGEGGDQIQPVSPEEQGQDSEVDGEHEGRSSNRREEAVPRGSDQAIERNEPDRPDQGVEKGPGRGDNEVAGRDQQPINIVEHAKNVVKNDEIDKENGNVNLNPSEAQKEAGNYKKAHINVQGFDITIENPAGSIRSGVDQNGKEWSNTMQNHYGYFKRTNGKDGDQIDVFVGNKPESRKVFVVDQVNPGTKEFDESKVMLGFESEQEAHDAYMSNYEEGWQGLSAITETDVDSFKKWLYDGAKQRKPFSEYKENQNNKQQSGPIDIVKAAKEAAEKSKQETYKKEVIRLSDMFGTDVVVHENLDNVGSVIRKQIESGGRTPGWYLNGVVHIYLPHAESRTDIQETFFHEAIAHKGLRELFGERFNDVMLNFFDKLPKNIQDELLNKYKSYDAYKDKTDQELKIIAADEFIASVAEKGEFMNEDQRTVIQRIVDAIKEFFRANNIEARLEDIERLANDYLKQSAERLEQNANRSVNNTNNHKNEEAPLYRTKNGRQLQFNFLSDQEIQDQKGEANTTGTRSDDIQREENPFENKLGRLKPGEFSHVERVFTEKAHFDFTGSDKIETVEDVVSIFDKLEDSAVENSFVVYEKNGRATAQHLGIGSFSSTQVNVSAMVEGARRIDPEKIYFIHNHPTGNLTASSPDTAIYKALKNIFGDKLQDGIIINLKTGKYGIFNDKVSESRNKTDKKGDVPVRVFSFDKIVFDKNHYPENLTQIKSPSDVASFISGHRLGERDKMSFLVVDRQLKVVSNFFTDEVEVNTTNAQELAKDMLAKAITYGGEGVIVYGRFKTWGLTGLKSLGKLINAKSAGNVSLIEAITIKEGDVYESAAEQGVLEAEVKYTAESKPMSKSDQENILFRTIQDKNKLVALHNISADNLLKASRIGGFSMPSIAITKPEISFQQYGEITLIGTKEMIDPKIKTNKVYGADAYTTRYPSISYEVKNTNPIKEIVSKMPVDNGILGELLYDISNDGDAYLYENRNIRLMFAHQKGADIFKTVETDIAKPVIDFIREIKGYDHLSIRDNEDVKTKLGKIIADGLSDKHKKIYERVGLLENGVASESLINDTFDAVKEYIRKEGQVDVYQSIINAREYIKNNNLEEEIKRFARDLYEQLNVTERIFKGYTKNGTPRYVPHTLENVLKEMKANKGVGIEGLGGNFGQLRAKLVPEFKSIKGIKDKAHKLADNKASEEEYNKALEQYYEISGKLEKYHKWSDDWLDTRRNFNDEIISLVRNGESESFKNLPKDLQEDIKTFAANVENIPTDYFGAKPERAIALSEFNSAVVPEGSDQRIVDILKNSGVAVHEYTDNNRMEVIQDVSRKNDLMFRVIGEIGASRAEGAGMIMSDLGVAREMESKGKDVKNIRLATGWERGADGKWRYEVPDTDLDIDDFSRIYRTILQRKIGQIDKLKDSELIKSYPEIADILISFENVDYMGGYGIGAYAKGSGKGSEKIPVIVLSDNLYKEYLNEIKPINERLLEIVKIQKFGYSDRNIENAKLWGEKLTTIEELNEEERKLRGEYNEITDRYAKKMNSVLVHEIQHAIQKIEGFAKGSNTAIAVLNMPESELMDIGKLITDKNDTLIEKNKRELSFKEDLLAGIENKGVEKIKEYSKRYQELEKIKEKTEAKIRAETGLTYVFDHPSARMIDKEIKNLEKETEEAFPDLTWRYIDEIYRYNTGRLKDEIKKANKKIKELEKTNRIIKGAKDRSRLISEIAKYDDSIYYSAYKRVAGEVEARNVQARMDLDPKTRRETLLSETEDVAREEQIILFRSLEQSNQEFPATISIDGVERSTTNSEGKPIAQTEEGVRNFWKWFGDSKVVDAEGRPLVVYHGTNADFNTFDKDKIGKNHYQSSDAQGGGGFFFVDKKHYAFHGKGLKALYLKLEDPYMNNGFEDYYYAVDSFDANHLDIYDTARERKNDGVIMMSKEGGLFVAFNPNQIKSATNNTGTFDPINNDIRFRHEDSKDVALFKYGEGGTKGVFKDSKGNLYKSLTRQENVYDSETKSFSKRDVPGETNEYEILKELQDNRNIVKVRDKVNTQQGPMFEMETLNEVDKLTYNEYNEIKNILEGINNQGYFVNDFVTVMRRPETNELVIVDFSSGLKNKSLIGDQSYDDRRNMNRLKDLLTKEDKEKVEIDYHNENERRLAKYIPGYEPDIRFRTVDESGFYSTAESALEGIKQNKGTPQQFKAMLLKNGAKQAELDWMDYDGTFTGKSVTKTEIQDWIDQNRIEVEEVEKGGFEWKGNDLIVGGEVAANLIHNEDGTWSYQSDFSEGEEVWETKLDAQKEAEEAIIGDAYSPNATKYSQYTLPGGKNYRELLLTMPAKVKEGEAKCSIVEIRTGKIIESFYTREDAEKALKDYHKHTGDEIFFKIVEGNTSKKPVSDMDDFQSSHFNEPNILAHVRFNEREANGERVLFIEEIQSDWAQKGKKEGFKGTIKELPYNYEVSTMGNNFYIVDPNRPGGYVSSGRTYEEAKENALKLLNGKGIPDMPFKKTDQWVNLALRRMMMYAAENGYDRIAWTTGEQQAERYDLSKQVDWIEYGKNKNGTYWFTLPVEYSTPSELTEQELESYVGKDITKKMIDGEGIDGEYGGKRLQGNDLKVGGSGMIAFYDQIVPKAAKKLAKPFDANIELINIDKTGEQLSIPITGKMKESVSKGVPLFRSVNDAAESAGSAMTEQLRKEYDQKYSKFATRFREAWEDMYIPVKQFLDVLRENGVEVAEYNDFYKQATFTSGKNDAQLDFFRKTFQKQITEQISNLQKLGFEYRDIENYVFAKHGLERNDFMAKQEAKDRYAKDIQDLQKDYKDGNIGEEELEMGIDVINLQIEDRYEHLLETKDYSGITALEEELEKTAEEYIAEFEEKAEEENIAKLWDAIKKATDYTLERQYKSGRISKETYDELKARYKNFVPLRGHDAETAEDRWDYTPDMGTYYTEPLLKAKGRKTRAESPFAYIEQMAHSAITWGNKNELKQTLLRLARKDTKGLLSVSETWFRNMGTEDNPVWEQVSAEYSEDVNQYLKNQRLFEEQMQDLEADGMAYQGRIKKVDVGGLFIKPKQAEQHEIRVNQNGVDYTIYINGNPAVARAVNGSNRKDISKSLGAFSNVTRNMAANFTTRNPLFVMTNFSRDYIFASSILMAKESPAYAVRFQRNIPSAMGSLQRYVRGKLDLTRPNDLMMYEYIMNGAKTGFSNIFELDRVAKKLNREATKGTKKKNALDYGRAILDGIDALNEMAENMSRLAVYMTSRKEGRSITQSVHDAKNVTVNFNQKGAGTSVAKNPFEAFIFNASSYVRPLFLFTNAAIQALSNVAKNFAKNPSGMAKIVSSYAIVGFLNPLLLSLIGGGEAEDDYMKLSDWERQNNWCIWLPSGFIKIPLPHELRVFHRIGDNIYQAVFKNKDILQTLLDTAMSFSDLLPMNPMGSVDTSWAEIIPDAARPFAQIATNTNFMGSRVYDQWASKSEPGYLKARTNKKGEPYAPQFMIDLFKSIDHATGGDGVKKGLISPNPDIVNHLLRGYFGGLYTLSEQGVGIAAKTHEWTKTGEFKLKVRETPLRTFYADANDLNIQGSGLNTKYFKVSDDVIEKKRRIKRYSEQLVNGEITNDAFQEKLNELNIQAVNEINEYIKTIKKYESALSDMNSEEQKDAEKIISDLKKTVIELGNGI